MANTHTLHDIYLKEYCHWRSCGLKHFASLAKVLLTAQREGKIDDKEFMCRMSRAAQTLNAINTRKAKRDRLLWWTADFGVSATTVESTENGVVPGPWKSVLDQRDKLREQRDVLHVACEAILAYAKIRSESDGNG